MNSETPEQAAQILAKLLTASTPITVLTGAGISTDSGIPAYRDHNGVWQNPPPVQHQQFMQSHKTRQRYWARSLHGWPRLYHAKPNLSHQVLAQLQQRGLIGTIITQNVDQLHQRAGAIDVIDLHGDANTMRCMSCDTLSPRLEMHQQCLALNPHYAALNPEVGPDGDARLEGDFSDFEVPSCQHCDGILKPDVVYFGDNVPRARVERAQTLIAESAGLLVIGSSLTVFSGFRFARQAYQLNKPLILLNLGVTRADDIATHKLSVDIKETLERVLSQL
ncbi:NAD-dependent protein deacetylase [Pseudidiomarina taiwanensis]|uniref:protein acetyllysine N-acetyltransferase n=1 Tax=Pseudidiomarina taiwanensis TaxID=337250 RepID=A0A432ZEJ2_9GAMM|nr:NAD-dependent protein deacetylase [Pseudidiomarina taiwanensis]RUO76341.1 NAD-dependent protein deacetylase [Pseudidiomarina taiwanensis]